MANASYHKRKRTEFHCNTCVHLVVSRDRCHFVARRPAHHCHARAPNSRKVPSKCLDPQVDIYCHVDEVFAVLWLAIELSFHPTYDGFDHVIMTPCDLQIRRCVTKRTPKGLGNAVLNVFLNYIWQHTREIEVTRETNLFTLVLRTDWDTGMNTTVSYYYI